MRIFINFLTIVFVGFNLIIIHAQESQVDSISKNTDSEIKELKIKSSGFFSDDILIIKYRNSDKEIVDVIDNGESLPPEKFKKYEPKLYEVLEHEKMREILPDIEELNEKVKSSDIPDSIKIKEFRVTLKKLDKLQSELAETHKGILKMQLDLLAYKKLQMEIRKELKKNKIYKLEGARLKLDGEKCYVDDVELSKESAGRIRDLYETMIGKKMHPDTSVEIEF